VINSVRSTPVTNLRVDSQQKEKTTSAATDKKESTIIKDTVEIGTGQESSTIYKKTTKNKLGASEIAALKEQAEKALGNLKSLVEKLILQQGKGSKTLQNLNEIDLTGAAGTTQTQTEEDPFGVKAVSDRIVDFAIAISGNDKTKLEELKASIDKGFSQASKSFGGELPDICQDTYTEIMKKLDEWGKEEE